MEIQASAAIAFSAVFANAMLPDLIDKASIGRLSSWAWGLGYLGGFASLAVALVAISGLPHMMFVDGDAESVPQVRVIGPLVAAWLALFMVPLFALTPDRPSRNLPFPSALREGLTNLNRTVRDLRRHRGLLLFLLANMLYADGLATLFAFGGVYVSGTFGMDLHEVIVFGLVLNVTAGIGAFAFGWVDDWLGSRCTIGLALVGLFVAGLAAVSVQTRPWLWGMGCLLGIFVDPVQASSRSLIARLSPSDRQSEYFGLLALSSKATAFTGPIVAAIVTEASGGQRLGLATILVFLGGGILLLLVSGRHREADSAEASDCA